MLRLFAVLAAFFTLTAPAHAQGTRPRCGTAIQFDQQSTPIPFQSASARTAATVKLQGRTLITPHFALHYTLARSTHQPAWKSGDAGDIQLRSQRDTLYERYSSANPTRRDSLINAALDSMGAAHPAFVISAAAYFENAYGYDKDSLGMRAPDSNTDSFFSGTIPGKFNVEIGDIDALLGGSYDGTYGLTFIPVARDTGYYSAAMLIENDFLYDATVNANGAVSGKSIKVYKTDSSGHSQLLHDYGVEWDMGLAVTIAHEFYHAVQFEYTPTLSPVHAWYELTAVGMEERLAPTVNDYLGYLPSILSTATPTYLLTGPGDNVNYGNGIFHTFLSQALGKTFDAAVWQRLSENSNDLSAALLDRVGSQARWDSLYSAYAASLTLAGLPGSAASPLAFSPDFALWPKPRFDTVQTKTKANPTTSLSLSRLTYRLVAPVSGTVTLATYSGLPGSWRVVQSGATYSSQYLTDTLVPIYLNGTIGLAVANSSFSTNRTLTLARGSATQAVAAFPNPARRSETYQIQISCPVSGTTATLTIVSESGRRVAALTPDPTGSFWTWVFRDAQNQAFPEGLYYYGIPGETPQTLLVMP